MKKIEKPFWDRDVVTTDFLTGQQSRDLDQWFDEYIQPINDALDEAVEVYSYPAQFDGELTVSWMKESNGKPNVNKALLINIEPIKQETSADVLRRWVNMYHRNDQISGKHFAPEIEKAVAALERENV